MSEKTPDAFFLLYYAWHCKHHTAQIAWVYQQQGGLQKP